jgi:hypothetical protein
MGRGSFVVNASDCSPERRKSSKPFDLPRAARIETTLADPQDVPGDVKQCRYN